MFTEWSLTKTLPADFVTKPLRQLLATDWQLPKHLIYSLKRGQRVLVNDQYLPVNFTVKAGDTVALTFVRADFRLPESRITPDSAATVRICYEDDNLLVVNKTAGSKTHPNQPGELGSTLNHVAAYLAPRHQQAFMVHRLDQATSGALIVGKNPAVIPPLVAAIKKKEVSRTYRAWVHGTGLAEHGRISLPIGRDPEDKRKRLVNGPQAQAAVTHYRVLKETANATLVAVQLETGRTHQIRVHLAAISHPIIGDPLYAHDDAHHLLLHSYQVMLPLPFDFKTITVTAPTPDYFTP
ncbi:RluA family pseudouridine synthase [uncultured Secundilactobacillus sp.]|uniref:RluA family pseudouridine synthase n=1 Tax=uncultured Secundilactobacillus sp. TaxID=2813935 RepID=UPI00258B871C|nr:RluA family pseudouridine synthase [uncultured Secundilactobacillus sp.]